MVSAPPLLSQVDGDILILTLNRPDKLNAISHEMMALLEEGVLRFRDTPELKVALIRSTGRYFCAGADMRGGLSTSPRPTTARGYREMHRVGIGHMHPTTMQVLTEDAPKLRAKGFRFVRASSVVN